MSDWLGMAAPPRTPRPELKDQVLRRSRSGRRIPWAMLAAAVLVGALGGGGLFRLRAVRLEGNLAAARDTLDLLRQPGGRVLMIPVTTVGRPGALTVYVDSLTRRWLVTCHHFTPNLPGQAYQLWFLTGSVVRPAAIMPMDRDVPMVMTLEVPREAGKVTGLAMSVEPRAGSTAPTGALVFRVEL